MDDPVVQDLNADSDNVMEMESLCLQCYEQGMTRLMLTRIPFFREVIISSFQCEHCYHHDTSIQPGGMTQEKGILYKLNVTSTKDLDRTVVKSDYGVISIPELDFEQPSRRKGEINTIEGILESVKSGLLLLQEERRKVDPDTATKIDEFILKMDKLKAVNDPFTFILDDPSGNSFLENPLAPSNDANLVEQHYVRSKQQDILVGCRAEDDDDDATASHDDDATASHDDDTTTSHDDDNGATKNDDDDVDTKKVDGATANNGDIKCPQDEVPEANWNFQSEVMTFQTNCPECTVACSTNMKLVDIPFFKQVVIMATVCDACGHRDNEVKGGTGVEPLGRKITLFIKNKEDLNRDVLKSDTAGIKIPELDFEMVEGSLGGRFTTVEGLLTQIKDQLSDKNPFIRGDSSQDDTRHRVLNFCEKLDKIIKGELKDVTLELNDPAGNSYLQSLHSPNPDPQITTEDYERNYDQNEELGLNDMKTENYSNDE